MAQSTDRSGNKDDFGYGDKYVGSEGRLIFPDGSYNIDITGKKEQSAYTFLIKQSWLKFLLSIFLFFIVVNVSFAILYYLIGPASFSGIRSEGGWPAFLELVYFSIQTSTTVGYGHIAPLTNLASIVSGLDAFVGLLIFALFSGLFFARFSRSNIHMKMSDKAIVAPYRDITSLQFRIVNAGPGELVNIEAWVTATWVEHGEMGTGRKFQALPLEREKVTLLPLNWTIVHPIDDSSPFYEMDQEEADACGMEVLIHISGYNKMYQNTVHLNRSFTASEIIMNKKFVPMYEQVKDRAVLYMDKLSKITDPD